MSGIYSIWSKSEQRFLTEGDVSNYNSTIPILGIMASDLELIVEDAEMEEDWEVVEVTLVIQPAKESSVPIPFDWARKIPANHCQNCGNPLWPGHDHCDTCGRPIAGEAP